MAGSRSLFLRYRLPAILWAVLIFVGSSIPSKAFPVLKIFDFDKLIHISIFFVFGVLVYRAFAATDAEDSYRWSRAILAIGVVLIYGVIDEFHQSFVPGRSPDVWDATADTVGGILSMLVLFLYRRVKAMRRRVEV